MRIKRLLHALFDYQNFSPNKNLERIINSVHNSDSADNKKISEEDLEGLSAAGVIDTKDLQNTLKKK